jgi:hypothetical protein
MLISKVVPTLLRDFEFSLDDPSADLEAYFAQLVWHTNALCRVAKRSIEKDK